MRKSKVRKSKVRKSKVRKSKVHKSKVRKSKVRKSSLLGVGILAATVVTAGYLYKKKYIDKQLPKQVEEAKNISKKPKNADEIFKTSLSDIISKKITYIVTDFTNKTNKNNTNYNTELDNKIKSLLKNKIKDEDTIKYYNNICENLSMYSFDNNIYVKHTEQLQDKYKYLYDADTTNIEEKIAKLKNIDIIQSQYKENHDIIENIYGPIAFFRVIYKEKEILLFADEHLKENKGCKEYLNTVNIIRLIELIILCNKNITVDFFMEDWMNDINIYRTKRDNANSYSIETKYKYIVMLRDKFGIHNCKLIGNEKLHFDCSEKFKNLRYHLMDYTKDMTIFEKKIIKQTKNMNNEDINKFEKFKIYLKSEEFQKKVNKYEGCTYDENRITMDLYSLSRMLRSFDGYHSKHIIVYAGACHIDNYLNFFNINGATIESYNKNGIIENYFKDLPFFYKNEPNEQCINVKGSNLPLFKNNILSNEEKNKVINLIKTNEMNKIFDYYNN